jgi:hypothetical protein
MAGKARPRNLPPSKPRQRRVGRRLPREPLQQVGSIIILVIFVSCIALQNSSSSGGVDWFRIKSIQMKEFIVEITVTASTSSSASKLSCRLRSSIAMPPSRALALLGECSGPAHCMTVVRSRRRKENPPLADTGTLPWLVVCEVSGHSSLCSAELLA